MKPIWLLDAIAEPALIKALDALRGSLNRNYCDAPSVAVGLVRPFRSFLKMVVPIGLPTSAFREGGDVTLTVTQIRVALRKSTRCQRRLIIRFTATLARLAAEFTMFQMTCRAPQKNLSSLQLTVSFIPRPPRKPVSLRRSLCSAGPARDG